MDIQTIAAIVGIIISVTGIIIGLVRWYHRRIALDIGIAVEDKDTSLVSFIDDDNFYSPSKNPMLIVRATNSSRVPVHIEGYGFILPNKKVIRPSANVLGGKWMGKFLPGEEAVIWVHPSELAKSIKEQGYKDAVKIIGFYQLDTGEMYKSKKIVFNLEQ